MNGGCHFLCLTYQRLTVRLTSSLRKRFDYSWNMVCFLTKDSFQTFFRWIANPLGYAVLLILQKTKSITHEHWLLSSVVADDSSNAESDSASSPAMGP